MDVFLSAQYSNGFFKSHFSGSASASLQFGHHANGAQNLAVHNPNHEIPLNLLSRLNTGSAKTSPLLTFQMICQIIENWLSHDELRATKVPSKNRLVRLSPFI